MARVGVLAVQGGFAPHVAALEALGHEARLVRAPRDLDDVEGLVLPGGESTAQIRGIDRAALRDPLHRWAALGLPVLATCAGLILVARHVSNPAQASFGWLDASVARNAWGRQVDSFEAVSDEAALPLVFIRAPRIEAVAATVEVLARYRGEPVLVRQGNLTAATFHPELTADRRVHARVFAPRATSLRAAG